MNTDVEIYQISKKEMKKIKSLRRLSSYREKERCIMFVAANNKAYKCTRVDFIGLKAVENFKKMIKEQQEAQIPLL